MSRDKLLTIREVASYLKISEEDVRELSEKGKIPAYKIGGVHLRFKKEQIEEVAKEFLLLQKQETLATYRQVGLGVKQEKASFIERVKDFFYFNDFYIISVVIILIILFIIFRT